MFRVSDVEKLKCLEILGQNYDSLNNNIATLRKWLANQPHFPKIEMSDLFLTNILIRNKFSIENCKSRIDMYITMRKLAPDFYKNRNPNLPERRSAYETNMVVATPTLTSELSRVFYVKLLKPKTLDAKFMMQELMNVVELRLREDFSLDEIGVVDIDNLLWEDHLKITPTLLYYAFAVYRKVFNMRLKAVYVINSKPIINKMMSIIKPCLAEKLFGRIHSYEGTDCLKTLFSDDQIPLDYGGSGPSMKQLQNKLRQKYLENKELYETLDHLEADESLRPEKLNNDEILGYYGSFKKLEVD